MAVVAVLAVAVACTRPSAAPPPPYREAGAWSWVPVGTAQPEPVAEVAAIERVRLGNGLWEVPGSVQDTPGRQATPALWVAPDGARWQPVGVPVPDGAAGATTSVADDGRLGLLGGVVGSGPSARPTVWRSTDGWRWEDPVTLPLPAGASGAAVRGIARGGPGWVAVGGPVAGATAPALVWTSTDGRAWQVSGVGAAEGEPPVTLDAVAVRDATVVALGVTSAGTPVAATSDGTGGWSSSPLGAGFVGRPAAGGEPAGPLGDAGGRTTSWLPLTISGDRFVTAAATAAGENRLLTSERGASWAPGPVVPGRGQVRLGDRDGRVRVAAAGSVPSADLTLAELDGDRWQTIPGPPLADGGSTAPSGPVVTGISSGGWVVLGPRPLGEAGRRTWRSVGDAWAAGDARDVAPAERRQGDRVLAVAATSGAVVAAGTSGSIAAAGTGPVAPAGQQARLWSSTDAVVWTEVPVTAAGEVLRAVAVDESGGVLVAGSLRPDEGGGPLWLYARDGRAFERRGPTGPGVPAGGIEPAALLRAGGRWVVVGRVRAPADGAGRAGIWSSDDGAQWRRWDSPELPGALTGVCSSGTDLWAVGAGTDGGALVWRSTAGGPFAAVPGDGAVPLGWQPVGCTVSGDDVIVAGLAGSGRVTPAAPATKVPATAVLVRWTSGDQVSVQQGPAAAAVGGVVVDGDAVVVVGAMPPAAGQVEAGGPAVWRVDRAGTWALDPDVAALVAGPPPGRAAVVWAVPPGAPLPTGSLLVGGSFGDGGFVLRRR